VGDDGYVPDVLHKEVFFYYPFILNHLPTCHLIGSVKCVSGWLFLPSFSVSKLKFGAKL